MILFKACPRCGGDVDTTFQDDAFCIQCGCRPPVAPSDSRNASTQAQAGRRKPAGAPPHQAEAALDEGYSGESWCPRCDSDSLARLEKLRACDNTCYRCRKCGHIFSPRIQVALASE